MNSSLQSSPLPKIPEYSAADAEKAVAQAAYLQADAMLAERNK